MAGAILRPASIIMANPTTTHVIEIETGIGEPTFIPLSLGHELQPISVGKKGMWRIESARVLDVHAFVYFDGTSLFLQSADEQNAASVDGYRVGKAWTELHAPCNIEVGAARLRYRSLIADEDNQPTMMAHSPPVQMPPGGPGGMRTGAGASIPVAGAPPPPAPGNAVRLPTGGQPPQQGQQQQTRPPTAHGSASGGSGGVSSGSGSSGSGPVAFPKAERPFKPGEFSSPADLDESTRIAPLDATGGGRVASGSHPRPAAGQPAGDDGRMMRGNTGLIPAAAGSSPYAMQGPGGMQPDMMQQGGMPPPGAGGMQSGGYPQQGYPAQPQGYGAHGGYSAGGSGAFNAMTGTGPQLPPGMQGQVGPSMPPGGYGSMTPQGGMPPPTAPPPSQMQELVAKLKANSIPKIIAGVLFIIGGMLYLAEDDEPQPPPKKRATAQVDGGPVEGGTAASVAAGGPATGPALTAPPVMTQAPSPSWPAGVPCPPPNWPPNTPLPCTPNVISSPPDKPDKPDKPDRPGRDAGAGRDGKDAGATLPAGTKTLERQAVDHVAAGETAKAAATYEELMRRDPNNKVYAEAARILRAKLDGGLPGGP